MLAYLLAYGIHKKDYISSTKIVKLEIKIENIINICYKFTMSPTVFAEGNYRFHFFSKEENRIHIHVISPEGEAKFWLEPTVSLVNYSGFSKKRLNSLQKTVERRKNEIIKKWKAHFKS